MSDPKDVTRLLDDLRAGRDEAFPDLLAALQQELRRLAGKHLAAERPDHTLQPTALVNEAYLKLIDQRSRNWESRGHFLAIASKAMRRVLVQHARDRLAQKRGGERGRVTLFEAASVFEERPEDLVALEEALDRFAAIDPDNARIVELRFFAGLTNEEAARTIGVSSRTVERGWRASRAWLRDALEHDAAG
ncbi:MAG: sigma-70 family RNA polymerase sigma factor [Planctomycetota bacterium]